MNAETAMEASEYTTLHELGMSSAVNRRVAMCKQQTIAWFALRIACLTGSKASRLIGLDGTLKAASTRDTLLNELVIERLMNTVTAHGGNTYAMERGNICEKLAKINYWLEYAEKPIDVGYVVGEPGRYGCSPDALLPDDRGLEVKCRTAKEHLHYLRKERLTPDDMMQVQFDMWVCGMSKWVFYAYWPNDTEHALIETADGSSEFLRLPSWLTTVEADERIQEGFAKHVPEFCDKVESEVERIGKMKGA